MMMWRLMSTRRDEHTVLEIELEEGWRKPNSRSTTQLGEGSLLFGIRACFTGFKPASRDSSLRSHFGSS